MSGNRTLLGYALLSVGAALILTATSWYGGQHPSQLTQAQKVVVSVAFMASCALGIILSSRPRFLRWRREQKSPPRSTQSASPRYVAHHPDCGSFDDRVVKIRGKRYCGGCLGLALGSLLALALTGAYVLAPGMESEVGVLSLSFGIGLVALSLVGIGTMRGAPWSHLLANALLVVGFFFVTVGVLASTGRVAYGLMTVVVCFLWLDTRIQLSEWRHGKTCGTCGKGCGLY